MALEAGADGQAEAVDRVRKFGNFTEADPASTERGDESWAASRVG